MADFDLAIIGGGINGAGIARDAAGRGLRVLLVEQNDLASGTSSTSTKLIHGGLRYLEYGAFRLVREALAEREVLWRIAPHLVHPMRFVLPPQDGGRSPTILRIGLFLYDHIGGRDKLPATRTVDLTHHYSGAPLKRHFRYGYEYSDCWTDDSRLVVLNALDAAERGAVVRTRTRCVRADRDGMTWQLALNTRGRRDATTARVLINATGPWVGMVNEAVLRRQPKGKLRLDKGTHIVVPKLFEHDGGYAFPLRDGRVVFAVPFDRDFTLIGTTDANFTGDPGAAGPSPEEITYLCTAVNHYFRTQIGPVDVVWAFAGVRPLYGTGRSRPQDATRDYVLDLDVRRKQAPLLTVYGGKITTYRQLAEAALNRLVQYFKGSLPWTAHAALPGGNFPADGFASQIEELRRLRPFLSAVHADRLVRAYGTRVERVLGPARSMEELGPCFGADLTGVEVRYLMQHEWAQTADDVLWRRSKLGLRLTAEEREALARFMAEAIV